MNYYQAAVFKIREQHYPRQYLVDRVIAAKHYIDQHLQGDITLQQMADSACLSKFHFIRLFRQCYGSTPHQFLTERRMEKAKQLLQAGMGVAATCYALGFTSSTSFAGLFKKTTGYTPVHYRQKKQF